MQEHITLYYCEGASDKIYEAALAPRDGGHVVHFAYGRRGSALNTGSKTPHPVPYTQAKAIYDRLVRSKLAKGYRPGDASAQPGHTHADTAGQDSGLRPQLLNPVSAADLPNFLRDPAWAMQEKHDGVRLLLRRAADGAVEGINRRGLFVSVPPAVAEGMAALRGSLLLDGEYAGGIYHAFDLLEAADTDLRVMPYHARLFHLSLILAEEKPCLCQVVTATTTACKTALFEELEREGREGVVFKRLDAPCRPGRPATAGDAMKWKFYETASFIVRELNAQRSAGLGLLEGGRLLPAGNVAIPANHPLPAPGDIVEVRYLYAFPDSGAVYQPVYLGRRADVEARECHRGQLKFKPRLAA